METDIEIKNCTIIKEDNIIPVRGTKTEETEDDLTDELCLPE